MRRQDSSTSAKPTALNASSADGGGMRGPAMATTSDCDVGAAEVHYKQALMSRTFGLNGN